MITSIPCLCFSPSWLSNFNLLQPCLFQIRQDPKRGSGLTTIAIQGIAKLDRDSLADMGDSGWCLRPNATSVAVNQGGDSRDGRAFHHWGDWQVALLICFPRASHRVESFQTSKPNLSAVHQHLTFACYMMPCFLPLTHQMFQPKMWKKKVDRDHGPFTK